MAEFNRKFTDEELAKHTFYKRDIVNAIREHATDQFLMTHSLAGPVEKVIKRKTKDALIDAYKLLYEIQDLNPDGKKAYLEPTAKRRTTDGNVDHEPDSEPSPKGDGTAQKDEGASRYSEENVSSRTSDGNETEKELDADLCLDDETRRRINSNRVYLITNLNAAPCIDFLQARGLISPDMFDELESKKSNPREQVTSLMFLVGRSTRMFSAFILALRDSNQRAILDRLSADLSMAAAQTQHGLLRDIKAMHHLIIENIRFEGSLLTHLEGRRVLTTSQVDELMSISTRRDRAQRLLRLLEKGETEERTRGLVSALYETDQPHLAILIDTGDDSQILSKRIKEGATKGKVRFIEGIRDQAQRTSLPHILSRLEADGTITSAQSEAVQAAGSPELQYQQLFDTLTCRPLSVVRQCIMTEPETSAVTFQVPALQGPLGQDGERDSASWSSGLSNTSAVIPGTSRTLTEVKHHEEEEKADYWSGTSPVEEDLDDDFSGKTVKTHKGFRLKKSVTDQIHIEELRKRVADLGLAEWDLNEEGAVVKKTIGKGKYSNITVISHPQNPDKDIITKSLDEACIREFIKELTLITSLKHKNIVDLYGYGIDNDLSRVCLLEEYMAFDWSKFGVEHNSHDLYDFIHTLHKAGQVEEFHEQSFWIWHVAIDISKGIAFIHDSGVAHRDLKLQNILVANNPAFSRQRKIICKLGDFGEARAYSVQTKSYASTATFRTQRGTWSYMAPEIVLEEIESADHLALTRMDVWSYGICIHFILNPDLRNDPFQMNRSKSQHKTFVNAKHFMSQPMTEKEIPQHSDKYSFLREQYGYLETIRLMCLDYDTTGRPNFAEIVQKLYSGRKKEIVQNDTCPVQIAAKTVKQDIPDRVENATSAEQAAIVVQQDDQTLVKQEMTPLQSFRRAFKVSGRVISSSMDSEEITAILYHERILTHKTKQQMDILPEDSIEKSEAILRFLCNLPEKTFAYTEKVLSRAENGQKDLVDLWRAGKTPLQAPPHWHLLQKKSRELPDLIEPDVIRQWLFAQNILNKRDYENIGKCLSRMDKVEKIIRILRRKPFPDFTRFIEGLKVTNQAHVAEIITNDDDYPKYRPPPPKKEHAKTQLTDADLIGP